MTREEHVAWCKKRAHEYLSKGDTTNAVISMLSDMSKHPECGVNPAISMFGTLAAAKQDITEVRRFIDGFN